MKYLLAAAIVLGCQFFSASALADGPLRSIIVFGNEKTERETILKIISVPRRTYVDRRLIRDVDDRLVNSGLFKKVRVRKVDNRDGTADLRVYVAEKQLWFIFPVFQAWSGRYSGGAIFGEKNLFVPQGSTLALAQYGNESYRGFIAYDQKNLWGSDFTVRLWGLGRSDNVPLYNNATFLDQITMKDSSVALTPGYQWTNEIHTNVEIKFRRIWYGDSTLVPASGTKGNDVSLKAEFLYDSMKRRSAFLKGIKFKAAYQFAETRFGSDYSYHTQMVSWQQAFRLGKHFNYVYDLSGAIADPSLPFHNDFTLGGNSLRGYQDRQFRGDTQLTAKQDLLFRLFQHSKFSVFGLVFHDLGVLYRDSVENLGRTHLHNGVGAGLRVSLSGIIAPVFGVDFGYGIEDEDYHIILALGLVDF